MASPRQNRRPRQYENRPERDVLAEALLGGAEFQQAPIVPQSNGMVESNRRLVPEQYRESYGIVGERLEVVDGKIRIIVDREDEPIKYGEQTPGDLDSKESLRNQALTVEQDPKQKTFHGRIAIETAPVLISGDVAVGFRGAGGRFERERSPLQTSPTQNSSRTLGEHFFIIGKHKKTGKREILVPSIGDDKEAEYVARATQRRVEKGIIAQIEQLKSGKGDDTMIGALNEKARLIASVHDIKVIHTKPIVPKSTLPVEVVMSGHGHHAEQVPGIPGFNEDTNTFTITQPVQADLKDYDLTFFDGTGRNRQPMSINKAQDAQEHDFNIIMREIEGQKLAQHKAKGRVVLEDPTPTPLLRRLYPLMKKG